MFKRNILTVLNTRKGSVIIVIIPIILIIVPESSFPIIELTALISVDILPYF